MPLQHNQLLTEQHVLQYQFPLAAGQISDCIQDWSMIVGLCPLAKTLFRRLAERIYALLHEGKR
jgi:hypothetical protein